MDTIENRINSIKKLKMFYLYFATLNSNRFSKFLSESFSNLLTDSGRSGIMKTMKEQGGLKKCVPTRLETSTRPPAQ